MRNLQKIRYPVDTLRNKWNWKKKIVEWYAFWLKDGIYSATNIGVEILSYIQIFILMKAALFLEGIQRSNLIIKKTQTNKARQVFDETNEKSGNYCK